MATITAAQTGNSGDTSTWVGGVLPTNADDVVIPSAYTVTLNRNEEYNSIDAEGTLNIQSYTLTLLDNDHYFKADPTITTGKLIFKPASGQRPKMHLGKAHFDATTLTITGTALSKAEVKTDLTNSGLPAIIIGGENPGDSNSPWLESCLFDVQHCIFTNMGDASFASIQPNPRESDNVVKLHNTEFVNCGGIGRFYNNPSDCTYELDHVHMSGTLTSYCLSVAGHDSLDNTKKYIDNCSFDKQLQFYGANYWSIDNSYLEQGYVTNDGSVFKSVGDNGGNFIRCDASNEEYFVVGTFGANFVFHDSDSGNPHFLQTKPIDNVINDPIFQHRGSADTGDCISTGTGGASVNTTTVRRAIVLKNGAGTGSSGTLGSTLGDANSRLDYQFCTYYTGAQGYALGETFAGVANQHKLKNCIGWDDVGTPRGYLAFDSGTDDVVNDVLAAADGNYNCRWNTGGYNNIQTSSGTHGANDIVANPQFSDATRDLRTFDALNGGLGTFDNALTELRKIGKSSFNSAYLPSVLVNYVKAGFAPTNSALATSGEGGGHIGAVVPSIAGGQVRRRLMLGVGM